MYKQNVAKSRIRWPGLAKEITMSEVMAKSIDYLLNETKEARQDLFLIDLVRKADSATAADNAAQELDYPTHLCRQIRLLFQMRQQYYSSAWKDIAVPCPVNQEPVLIHAYPCEWDVEGGDGIIKSTHVGTLVVTKNAAKAAVLWDYQLVDEDGIEMCHSSDLGRDWFMHGDVTHRRVNCHLNCGSRLIPRTGLKITFNLSARSLRFSRSKHPASVYWERYSYTDSDGNRSQPCIERHAQGEDRAEMKYAVCLKPLSKYDKSRMRNQVSDGSWGLFITASFLKRSSNPPGFDQFGKNYDVSLSVLCYITTVYMFRGTSFEKFLRSEVDSFEAERSLGTQCGPFNTYRSTWDEGMQEISPQEQSKYEGMYKPHSQNIEDVHLSVRRETPNRISGHATIQQLCDVREMTLDLFHNDGYINRNVLVPPPLNFMYTARETSPALSLL